MPNDPRSEILLDTHVWVWLVDDKREELGPITIRSLERASRAGALIVSVISVWEVAMLEAKGRVRLSLEIEEWVEKALSVSGLLLTPLDPAIAIDSTRLPDWTEGDPADRILVATARRRGARLTTRDRPILAYGELGHVSVLDASR
jgi:PIN domain nuclease of toxin-antitoxin system